MFASVLLSYVYPARVYIVFRKKKFFRIKQTTDKQEFVGPIEFNGHWEVSNYVLTHSFQFFYLTYFFITFVQIGSDLKGELLNTGQNQLHSLIGQINTGGLSVYNNLELLKQF